MSHLTWLEATVIGALQGVAELFPVSSLGHSILLPAVLGGQWQQDLDVSAEGSPYLSFVVGLHVATALAMIIYFWRDWVRILTGLVTSLRDREIRTADQRLGWLLVAATIPVGLAGVALDHVFRTLLAKPVPTAIFLVLNGLLLVAVEQLTTHQRGAAAGGAPTTGPDRAGRHGAGAGVSPDAPTEVQRRPRPEEAETVRLSTDDIRRRASAPAATGTARTPEEESDERLASLSWGRAIAIGAAQILALLPGISRSGATIGAGLLGKLSHEDAARFAFLLATPVILAAGVLKLGDLAGPEASGILPQVLWGSLLSGVGAYLSVRFLTKYFENRSMRPFGIYCVVAGLACLGWFALP